MAPFKSSFPLVKVILRIFRPLILSADTRDFDITGKGLIIVRVTRVLMGMIAIIDFETSKVKTSVLEGVNIT